MNLFRRERRFTPPKADPTPDREPMTRDQAVDVQIAFGIVTKGGCPLEIRPAVVEGGALGFDAVVPLEFIRDLPMVKAYLEGKRWI
jgi:hypothetical protein